MNGQNKKVSGSFRGGDTPLEERIRALQAYLGHKNIQHTVRYTELAPDRSMTCGEADAAVTDLRIR